MNEHNQWYVTIDGNAVGPVSTDLVVRGIKHKKIATSAYVCVVGANEWQLLADVAEFHTALSEGGLLEAALPRNGHHHDDVQGLPMSAQALLNEQPAQSQLEDVGGDTEELETTASFSSQRAHELAAAAPAVQPADDTAAASNALPNFAQAIGDILDDPRAPLPSFADSDSEEEDSENSAEPISQEPEPRNGKHIELAHGSRPRLPSMDVDIDVTVDDSPDPRIDWNRGFSTYFLVGSDVTLPDEQALLHGLNFEARETFLHDEAMWNLALCLAFGTDAVATSAASVFFDVVTSHDLYERIEWMCRTLLSKGFMPSGIAHAAGHRGITHLQKVCPAGLLPQLENEAAS